MLLGVSDSREEQSGFTSQVGLVCPTVPYKHSSRLTNRTVEERTGHGGGCGADGGDVGNDSREEDIDVGIDVQDQSPSPLSIPFLPFWRSIELFR